ncbi:MAG: hybrid sensor histidine kinase/response regulator [Deltaproteobacteria bacterium]|nr:hybrid sensor histidine kinase/response regulator [Deltaproteobacteria bacterium]
MAQILLVDDEDSYLEVLSDTLALVGHDCARAHDGREALAAATGTRPDLVVTDQMMPRMTGVELLLALRETEGLAGVPTILLSAIRPAGFELASRFVQKPVHFETIQRVVGELVEPVARARSDQTTRNLAQTREEALNWVAHEIKNPLGVATLNVELLLSTMVDDFERKHLLTLKRQLERMDELVVSVLDAASVVEGRVTLRRSPVELGGLVGELAQDWRVGFADHVIDLTVRQRAVCDLDRERAREILDNLVSNAVKYGGEDRRIEVIVDADTDAACVSVRDHGVGISPQDLRHIFERFHRAKQGGRGHGLGLYIAAALARLHGGRIAVDSKVGAGSTFTLRLPRSDYLPGGAAAAGRGPRT